MRISEIPPELRQDFHESQSQILEEIEASIKDAESILPENASVGKLCSKLQKIFSRLSSVVPLSDSVKLQIWKLSYRLWNACVDHSNAAGLRSPCNELKIDENQVKIRQIAADLLFLAGDVTGIPSPAFKSASFYYKTGLMWHDLKKTDLAANCFERATDLTSKIDINEISDIGERKLLLDLNLARSRTAWEVSDRNIARTLLNRSKNLLFGNPESYKALSNQYLMFGKLVLSKNQVSDINEALKLMNEALDLCEKGLRIVKAEDAIGLKTLRSKSLRFMAAAHLQGEEFESVLKCIRVLREGGADHHPSLPVLAMKAWLGLGRYGEAEKELRGMVVNKGIPEGIWESAVEAYFQAAGVAGAETTKGVFLGLLGRCHVSAGAAVRVAHRVVGGSNVEGSRVRAKVVAELVSDERVVALFAGEAATKERTAMHAVLWNWLSLITRPSQGVFVTEDPHSSVLRIPYELRSSYHLTFTISMNGSAADNFRAKDFETSAEMFEKSMLYVPYDIENRILRAKCFRVLCLCHLALSQLDRAQEYINEANKLEPNIACAFLKFKIYLQKSDENNAIKQMQAMVDCLDFTPDFLSLSAHEAIACRVLSVAVASLSNLLNFYSSGKQMSAPEIVVFRTLITVLIQEPDSDFEILKFTKRAHARMLEVGPDRFFGKGEVGKRERNWFAVNSWNIGTRNGKEKKYDVCAEFLELASEFYGVTINGELEENSLMLCKSLVFTVSARIAAEKQRKEAMPDSDVKQSIELLDRAGKILTSLSSGAQLGDDATTLDPSFFFIYTFNAYELRSRLNDPGPQQLLLIKNFASSKACTPKFLLQIGLAASQGPWYNHDVANFAINSCLSTLLASPFPDYQTIALIIRKLIGLAGYRKADTDNDEVYGVYKQAYRIIVGLKEGEYPTEEGKWLAMTAWNRAALPVRLGQIDVTRRWIKIGLELGRQVLGMVGYMRCMEDFASGFEKKFYSNDHGDNGQSRSQLVL